ncbi:hypothetical protein N7533_004159 [Penicillium manginii]|jgi:regulation of enolase protein 1 (concanavalin A-like superfamily)|uniref:uncharacterized protein n=1 Tax=Penicillium manginii TaxID=203109 RepID=UPI0025467433|nr:uncharacterized protein N7533_004159 [Penicillium manginii]KAJ5754616.1 hypothetical protein N7533_004159 [Penicillium manginii]
MSQFSFLNSSKAVPGNGFIPDTFTVTAQPSTDAWSNPPNTERFNAPILHRDMPLLAFQRVQVTIHANLTQKYDQGGLIMVVKGEDGSRKWVKAGLELVNDAVHLSTVSKDRGSDWCFQAVPPGCKSVTLEMIREKGDTLWIYLLDGTRRIPQREITWIFQGKETEECLVGVYAARPSKESGDDLDVQFEGLTIDTI